MVNQIPKFQATDPLTASQLNRLQDALRSAVNPVLALAILNGAILSGVKLKTGVVNPLNHGLGRAFISWWSMGLQGNAVVYQAAAQPNPALQLVLETSADVTLDVWVF